MGTVIDLQVRAHRGEARIDSRLIAPRLGIQHRNLIETIRKYQSQLEQFGQLPFETAVGNRRQGGGKAEVYCLLGEDQAVALMTLSRNTPRVVHLKMALVRAFRRFRDGQQITADYLPGYWLLHDAVQDLAHLAHDNGSTTPERFFHINLNRLVNSVFGLASGQRPHLEPELRAYVTAANVLAQQVLQEAMEQGLDHRQAYAMAKARLQQFALSVSPKVLPQEVA